MDQGLGIASNSPALATDPTEGRFVVMAHRSDAPDFGCGLQVSGDGGKGWVPAVPVPTLPAGAERCYAPEVAFGPDGTLYFLFIGLAGPGNQPVGAFLASSNDRARSFSTPRQVLGPANFGVRMALDPGIGDQGRLHLVWLHASSDPPLGGFGPPPNPILAAYSDDGGRSFSDPVQVSDATRERVVAPSLAVGPDHSVHVAYYDLGRDAVDYRGLEGPVWDGTWSLLVSSSDDGRRFRPGQVVDDGVVPSQRVMLVFTMPPPALVANADRRCVAWTDARHGDDDILLSCSAEEGRWKGLRRLNDDPVGNGRSQYLPRLSMFENRVDAVFYDRRADPANLHSMVSYTYSLDGQNFAPTTLLTDQASDIRIGQQYLVPSAEGLVEFGARLGLVSGPAGAVAAWADTRNSNTASTGQDLFSTTVELPSGARPAMALRVVGGAVAILGMALVALASRSGRRMPR